mgnify:CR=1 FL=1
MHIIIMVKNYLFYYNRRPSLHILYWAWQIRHQSEYSLAFKVLKLLYYITMLIKMWRTADKSGYCEQREQTQLVHL